MTRTQFGASNPLQAIRALQFAVDFAQSDLDRADLAAASNNLRDFFTEGQLLVRGKPWPLATLKEVQADAYRLLRGVLGQGMAEFHVRLSFTVIRVDALDFASTRGDRRVISAMNGPLRDRFLYQLKSLLELVGTEKLRQCPCGRLFIKVTRKEFCSTRCQARIYMRERRRAEREKRKKPAPRPTSRQRARTGRGTE